MTEERTTLPNPDAPAVPTLTSRHTAETIWYDRGRWSILADGASTSGSYCVFEAETPRDAGEELYIHDHTDKACYVLDGELDVVVDDQVHSLSKGSFSSFSTARFTLSG